MKDLGPKNYVLLQLQGTTQIPKLWICKRLNLRSTNTTSPPPSDGRGTQVVEEMCSGILGVADKLRPGNLNCRNNVTHTRLNFKLIVELTRCQSATAASFHRSLGTAGIVTTAYKANSNKKIQHQALWFQSYLSYTVTEKY